jgi:hypothetical protein
MHPPREGFGGVSGMNISGHLSAIPKPDKTISDAGRKSNVTKSVAAPVSRSQNHNLHDDDDLPDDGIKSQRIDNDSPEVAHNVFGEVEDVDQTELHDMKDGDSGLLPLASPEAHQNESLLGRGGDHSRFSDLQ